MVPKNLRYSETHEWVKVNGEDIATIGITDYAQKELGDIVYVETPEKGDEVDAGNPCGTLESVKAVEDLKSPVSGEIVDVNQDLEEAPEKINDDPYKAWIFKVRLTDPEEIDDLMDAEEYEDFIGEEE